MSYEENTGVGRQPCHDIALNTLKHNCPYRMGREDFPDVSTTFLAEIVKQRE